LTSLVPAALFPVYALHEKLASNLFHLTATKSSNHAQAPAVSGYRVSVFIKSNGNDSTLVSKLKSAGSLVHSTTGGIITAKIPLSRLDEIADYPEVELIQGAHVLYPQLDLSSADTNVDDVQLGNDIPKAYDGKGVIIGVLDSGIDYTHDDFIDNDGKTKILWLWDQTDDGGPAPDEISDSYGSEYTADDINDEIDGSPANFVRQEDLDGHGTHVAGIAASRGRATGNYKGVAPEADLIIVKAGNGTFSTDNILNGMDYMIKKANNLGRPIVINLYLGGHMGGHDGTSLEEKKIDNITGNGRIVVCAAGNQGDSRIHCGYWTTAAEQDTQFKIEQYVSSSGQDKSSATIDCWYDTGNIEFKLQAFDIDTDLLIDETVWIQHGDELKSIDIDSNGIHYGLVDAWAGVSASNGKRRVILDIYQADGNSGVHYKKLWWKLKTKGSGRFDAWISSGIFLKHSPVVATDGNSDMTVAMPGTASTAITVANYTTRKTWIDIDGNNQSYFSDIKIGYIAPSSSIGPTRNPSFTGTKPEIAAPGGMLIAPLSSHISSPERKYIVSTNKHQVMNGTSMASPFIAGVAALMLQKNKDLNPGQIEKYLTENATIDSITGNNLPDPVWGYGKVDALKTLKAVPPGTPPTTPPYGTIQFTADPQELEAETGSTTNIVSDVITDSNGNTVPDGTKFTILLYGSGQILTPDVDGDYPGLQLSSIDGKISLEYKAPDIPEKIQIHVSSMEGEADGNIEIPVYTKGTLGQDHIADNIPASSLDRCFIANAAYGTPYALEIRHLCNFRDRVLLKNFFGRIFVKTYYFLSPPVADFIGRHEVLRSAVRIGLIPFVWGAKKASDPDDNPWTQTLPLIFMSVLVCAGPIIFIKKRNRLNKNEKA
jgi:subtilisin family serine protease